MIIFRYYQCGIWAGKLFCFIIVICYLLWKFLEVLYIHFFLFVKFFFSGTHQEKKLKLQLIFHLKHINKKKKKILNNSILLRFDIFHF